MPRAMTPERAIALLKDRDSSLSQGDADLIALCIADIVTRSAGKDSLASFVHSLPQAGVSEYVTWYDAGIQLPDADLTVNIAVESDSHEPIWLGFFDGEIWRSVDGGPIDGRVTHWAPMLLGPAAPVKHARHPEVCA